jgi:hypothetical protein
MNMTEEQATSYPESVDKAANQNPVKSCVFILSTQLTI